MTYARRLVVLLSLLCISSVALGQDLTPFRMLGELVPHSPVARENVQSSILIYRNRGIAFHASRPADVVMSTIVFQPLAAPAVSAASAGFGSTVNVVAGVGAYGVTLGMSREQVGRSPYLANASKVLDDPEGMAFDLGRPRSLIVAMREGKVSQLDVHGPVVTAEGITERSSVAQIQAAYGPPDEYFDVVLGINPRPRTSPLLVLPFMGLATGFYLRYARSRMEDTPGRLAWLAMFGAIGLSIGTVAFLVVLMMPTGIGLATASILYGIGSSVPIGAGGVLAMELLRRRLPGLLGSIAALLISLVIALATNHIADMASPSLISTPAIADVLRLHGPFLVAMFVAAGARHRE